MDRLHHLRKTLPKNISDNADYTDLEFVILDYNSKDNLALWINENMKEQIKSGRIVYYKTEKPEFFHRSHSRNMMFRLAQGDILCNIDADNYTGEGFARFVNDKFLKNKNIFLTPIDFNKLKKNFYPPSDTLGRACFRKDDFFRIKGYDEQMITHGFQDYDFANRLELSGIKRVLIDKMDLLTAIHHDDDERLSGEPQKYNLKNIFIRPINHARSELLFLYNNNTYEKGIMIDNRANKSCSYKNMLENKIEDEYSIDQDEWVKGKWDQNDKGLLLFDKEGKKKLQLIDFQEDKKSKNFDFSIADTHYRIVVQQSLLNKLILFNRQITNRNRMYKNYKQKKIILNKNGFGKGTVIRNFDEYKKVFLT